MSLYEDALVVVELHPKPAVKGQVIVRPKRHVTHLSELSPEESAHLFTVASYTAAILFQGLQAEGTNIICNEDEEQLTLHVIARRQDDNLDFSWKSREANESEMNDALERLREAIDLPEESAPAERETKQERGTREVPEKLRQAEEEENELIKQLIRIP